MTSLPPEPQAPPTVPGPADPEDPAAPPKRRRRVRTALLITAALLLGTLAGAGTGYEIQHRREPTPLPPLAVDKPAYPAEHTKAAPELYRTDKDLRKLLVKRPKGATDVPVPVVEHGWLSLLDYAKSFRHPDEMFEELNQRGFRRAAMRVWTKGGVTVEVRLVQFREPMSYDRGTDDFLYGQQDYMLDPEWAGNTGEEIPGTRSGTAFVYSEPDREPGHRPLYKARSLARRGDVVMDIWLVSQKPVTMSHVIDLSKRQLERL